MPRLNPTDKKMLMQAMLELSMSQTQMGKLLGKSQSAISWVITNRSKLSWLERKEILRALTRKAATHPTGDQADTWTCDEIREPMISDEEWLEHTTTCVPCQRMMLEMRADMVTNALALAGDGEESDD